MDGCLACDLTEGRRELPGGTIEQTGRWLVEHCVGPLGVGTLIVKPKRHVVHVWELDDEEAAELGPLIARVTRALAELLEPDQVYARCWSHAGGEPVHIHWVVQPVSGDAAASLRGPHLQAAMFERGELPPPAEVEALAERLRSTLASEERPVLGIDHVQVAAPPGCEPEARRFFGAVLGLAELPKPESLRGRGGAWFSLGAQQLHVGVDEEFMPSRKAHPALRLGPDQLDRVADRLLSAGCEVRWDEALTGVLRLHTEDPWGNRLELLAIAPERP